MYIDYPLHIFPICWVWNITPCSFLVCNCTCMHVVISRQSCSTVQWKLTCRIQVINHVLEWIMDHLTSLCVFLLAYSSWNSLLQSESFNICMYWCSGLTSSFREGRPLEVTELYRLNKMSAATSTENSVTAKLEPFKVYSLYSVSSLHNNCNLSSDAWVRVPEDYTLEPPQPSIKCKVQLAIFSVSSSLWNSACISSESSRAAGMLLPVQRRRI